MTNSEKLEQLDVLERAEMCSKLCDVHISCWNCNLLPLCKGTMRGSGDQQWAEWLEADDDDKR